jgi:integrase
MTDAVHDGLLARNPCSRRTSPESPKVVGLPEVFRFHDLRHYLASLLIGSGLDVKVVQHRLRHGSAKTTLDADGHLWPDSDESARAAVGVVLAARADCVRTGNL